MVLLAVYAQEQGTRERVSLEDLGPIAVGADGSMHRIANWNELSQQERVAAQRALAKRNAKRLARLKEQAASPKGGSGSSDARHNKLQRALFSAKRWLQSRFRRRASRFLPPLDFAPEFMPQIVAGRKRATTRVISVEPHLGLLRAGDRVRATCDSATPSGSHFAILEITRVESTTFGALDDDLAAIENLPDEASLRETLLHFYPTLALDSSLAVLHFRLVKS